MDGKREKKSDGVLRMSTTIFENDKISLVRFWGGDKKGVCLQIAIDRGVVIFTIEELEEIIPIIEKQVISMKVL